MRKKPSCFISYAWEGKRHENWIAKLAETLVANGVIVHVDFWETHLGMDITHYMESKVRTSTHVLLVCTPKYADRADGRKGGVGYETSIVTGEVFSKTRSKNKFVPILRTGEPRKAMPSYLKGTLHVDFRGKAFLDPLKKLLRHIYDERERKKPKKLGGPPDFTNPIIPKTVTTRRKTKAASELKPSAVRNKQQKIKQLMKKSWEPGSAKERRRVSDVSRTVRSLSGTTARSLVKASKKL